MKRGRSPHPRITGPMLASPRCGAKTRGGAPCRSPAVRGKCRCRMHGGARGSGAPRGNRNALKHGLYAREALAERRFVNRILRDGRRLVAEVEKSLAEKGLAAAVTPRRRQGTRPARPHRRQRRTIPTGPPRR